MSGNAEFIRTSGEIKGYALQLTHLLYVDGKGKNPKKEFKTEAEVQYLLDEVERIRLELFAEYESNKNYDPESYFIE